jgi:DivIVA domain-containing protein
MADDRKIAISSSNHVGPDEVARHTFATSRRGFDPAEVRAFLEEVARELSAAHEREEQLEKDIMEAEHRAAHPVLDDETLTTALGQETAQVLRAAHEAASNLLKKAEAGAAELVANAERRDTQSRADAERASAEQAVRERGRSAARVGEARLGGFDRAVESRVSIDGRAG